MVPGCIVGRYTPTMVPGCLVGRYTPTMVPGLHGRKRAYPPWYPGYMRGRRVIPTMVPGLHERRV